MNVKCVALFFGCLVLAASATTTEVDDLEVLDIDEHSFDDELPSQMSPIADMEGMVQQDLSCKGHKAGCKTCYAVGDPHFRSFDKQYFHLQVVGQYILSKTRTQEVQVRTFPCGRHKYYGAVACYQQVAVKYTTPISGHTCVVEVATRGTGAVKVNGEAVNADKPFVTPCGSTVYRWWHPLPKNRKIRVVNIRHKDGTGMTVAPYALYVHVPGDMQCEGVCGNNDGKITDEDHTSGQNPHKTYHFTTTKECLDDNANKPIHKWGMTWRVDDKKWKSVFGDAAKKYNSKKFQPHVIKFQNDEIKKKAKDFCKSASLSYQFYVDCIDDIAATGKIQWGQRDVEAANEYARMRKTHKNYHAGKEAMLRVLGKMEIDFLTARDDIRENVANGKDLVARKRAAMDQANQQREAHCSEERKQRRPLRKIVSKHDKAVGAKNFEDARWVKNYKKWTNDLDRITRERHLIAQMQKFLTKLVNVKSTSELEVDQSELDKSPALRQTFQELIDRAHIGHTDVIDRLLKDLLAKLQREWDETHKSIKHQKETTERQTKLERDLRKERQMLQSKYDKQKKRCQDARADAKTKYQVYTATNKVVVKDIAAAGKALAELEDEVEMVKHLKEVVTDWSKNKNFKKCQAPSLDLETPSRSNAELEAAEDSYADSLPVSEDEDEYDSEAASQPDAEDADVDADSDADAEDDVEDSADHDESSSTDDTDDASARADDEEEDDDVE